MAANTPYGLYSEFPGYDKAVIDEIYRDCGYNEATTRQLLGGRSRNVEFKQEVIYKYKSTQHDENWKCRNCSNSNPLSAFKCQYCACKRYKRQYSAVRPHYKSYSKKSKFRKDQYEYVEQTLVKYPNNQRNSQRQNMRNNNNCQHDYKVVKSGAMSHSFERKKSQQQSSNSNTNAKVGIAFFGAKYNRTSSSSSYQHDNRSAKIECKDVDSGLYCRKCGDFKKIFDETAFFQSSHKMIKDAQ